MKQPKRHWTIGGLKAVILIVSLLVAAWGSPAPGHAYEIAGLVTPKKHLDVYVIVGNQSVFDIFATQIADCPSGVSTSFAFTFPGSTAPTSYTVIGLYDTTNGYVTIGLNSGAYNTAIGPPSQDWGDVFPGSDESTVASYLSSGDTEDLCSFFETYFSSFPSLGSACSLANFTPATPGGSASADLVPVPPSLLLLGSGLLGLAGWRRFKKG
jgi:hypothetical protein